MKIVVLSDVHNDKDNLKKIIAKHRNEAQLFVFLGDGTDNFEDVTAFDSMVKSVCVKGNWDYDSGKSAYEVFNAADKTFFITHGDLYDVDISLDNLVRTAKSKGADICLYGHTHIAAKEIREGLLVLNPGAVTGRGAYCIFDIADGNVIAEFKNLI